MLQWVRARLRIVWREVIEAIKEAVTTLATLRAYRAGVLPAVRDELASWRRVAEEIPDPVLRDSAISALTAKAANVEATAVLATLAPRPARGAVTRASAALQIAIDYLDVLGEQGAADPLRDGLQLHLALAAALTPGATTVDWYLHHPQRSDGGYLDRLVGACQAAVITLPSWSTLQPRACRAAERCGEGQSHTHAAGLSGGSELESWATGLAAGADFEWWEIAAGASSSVAAHALLALAGDPAATAAEAEAIDGAYFPAIGALTVILDDLVDRKADAAAGEHNYLRYYSGEDLEARRLVAITEDARTRTGRLRHRLRHRAILAGVVAFYLGSPASGVALEPATRRRVLAAAGPVARPLAALLR
jgi:tetraprenyl-beta-curcumene synthase